MASNGLVKLIGGTFLCGMLATCGAYAGEDNPIQSSAPEITKQAFSECDSDLTEKQVYFIARQHIDEFLWDHTSTLFENAYALRRIKAEGGDPKVYVIEIMNQERILPQAYDIEQWSIYYDMNRYEIQDAFAIYALGIIDGRPKYMPNVSGLQLLKNTGVLEYIDANWESFFTEGSKRKIIAEVQFGHPYPFSWLRKNITSLNKPNTALNEYLSTNTNVVFNDVFITALTYAENKFFEEEMPNDASLWTTQQL